MNQINDTASFALLDGEAGLDPIEERLRTNVRATIEVIFEEELARFLGRLRYDRGDGSTKAIATGTESAKSPTPSGPKRFGYRAPGSGTTLAR
jgi:hypothetical protein